MKTQSPDTSLEAERVLVELLRQAGPRRRFEMARDASRALRRVAWNGILNRHPDAREIELRRHFAVLTLGDEMATLAFGEAGRR